MKQKTEIKLLKALNKLFDEVEHNDRKDLTKEKGHIMILDSKYVLAIICKTKGMKRIMSRFANKDFENKIPKFDYTIKKKEKSSEICSKYDVEYLKKIINCFYAIKEHPRIYLKKDFPIKFEGEHFDFVLAPKIDYEK